MKIRIFLMTIFFFVFVPSSIFAATYYISPSGSDTTGDGTNSNPWRTFTRANGMMIAGDTLYYKDGIYDYSNGNISNPVSGNSGNYTEIKAENDGGAILRGYSTAVSLNGVSYVTVEGFTIKDGSGGVAVNMYNDSYVKIQRVSIKNGGVADARYGNIFNIADNCHHILVEDCWISGVARYGFHAFARTVQSYYIIFRRCVVRLDGNSEREPKAGFNAYGATSGIVGVRDVMFQNCIAIDFNSLYSLSGGFTNTHDTARIKHYGCIALNLPTNAYIIDEDPGTTDNEAHNSIAWDAQNGFVVRNAVGPTTFNKITAADITDKGFADWGTATNVGIKNSVFYSNANSNDGSTTNTYNLFYNSGTPPGGSNNLTNNPQFKYICRIETDSPAYQSGEGGVSRGAEVTKRYGVDGTLWGEPGYDQLTGNDLWPFPYEDRIRTDFMEADGFAWYTQMWDGSAPRPSSNNTQRGFCAAGQTLTKYIWEYLGNPCPADICNYNIQYHPADLNQNNRIEMNELIAFIGRWKSGQVTFNEVLEVLGRWLGGN